MARWLWICASVALFSCHDERTQDPSIVGISHATEKAETADAGPCAVGDRVPIDPQMVAELNLTEPELKSLQFFTASEFVLSREMPTTERDTAKHRLTVRNGVLYEDIVVKCLTPGRLIGFPVSGPVRDLAGAFLVSFEEGSGGFLFLPDSPQRNVKGNAYRLWNEVTPTTGSDHGNVKTGTRRTTFEDTWYEVRGESILLINREDLEQTKRKRRELKGWAFEDAGAD